MTVLLLRILFLPILIPKYLIKHPKALILAGVVFFVFIGTRSCYNSLSLEGGLRAEVPEFQKTAPVGTIPVDTPGRLYYTRAYEDDGQVVTLSDYYFYDGDTWTFREGTLALDRKYIGEIKVYERTN